MQIDLIAREHPGATDVGDRLNPNRQSITGAIVGSLVFGTIGWLVGWLVTGIFATSAESRLGAAIAAAVGGGIIGWLVGAIYVSHAPVEESYYREQRIEQGSTRLLMAPAGRDDEARRILMPNGARLQSPNDHTANDATDYDVSPSGHALS